MKLKILESFLQEVDSFEKQKVKLEQYETPAHIAARILYTAETTYSSICHKTIADLGCGCGMLTIGAALLGAAFVIGFEIDEDALKICKNNLDEFEIKSADLIQADVLSLSANGWSKKFDTVILNPPFGTKGDWGVDISFLKAGLDLSTHCVYSLHKTSTRQFILSKAQEWNVNCEIIASLIFNLPNTYKFHKKNSVNIKVDLCKFTHT